MSQCPDKTFSHDFIVCLFTMLAHSVLFDNAINLLEEILSIRQETFVLESIPSYDSLMQNFSVRQLTHFCRALSLLIFEPEDRLIIEGTSMIKSLELLQLRRDRMAKLDNQVEKNQSYVRLFVCSNTWVSSDRLVFVNRSSRCLRWFLD